MLELAQAAKHFGLNPAELFGFDLELADQGLITDFILLCSLRLILWDAYQAKLQKEALEKRQVDQLPNLPQQIPPELMH